jgi:hypothetical protein
VNQCDGCGRGLPVSGGLHRGEGYDLMACTADRYAGAQPKRDDQMKGILMSEISPEGEALPPSEREAFEREFKYISHEGSFSEWSERWTYRHSHVDALWCGWSARAVLAAPQNTLDHLAGSQECAPAVDALAVACREAFTYEPETGLFLWRKVLARSNKKPGDVAGSFHKKDGYVTLTVGRAQVRAHRAAWLFVHGRWPERQLDHINGNGRDNRIVNLRLATHTENQHNVGVRRDNKTGHKGVRYYSQTGKWIAGIRVNGAHRHLGSFPTKEAAAAAYTAAADELQGTFAVHRRQT